jgi:SAM-dependent methyltransferase
MTEQDNMLSSTQRFSDRVDFYVRARPKYPPALLQFFQTELKLSPADVVADIGSGTGILTELFVRNTNPVYAVEPNAPMRQAAEAQLGTFANFHSVNGTAENTTLKDASMNFITAAQAFHWFDPIRARAEFQRILKPNGIVALIWNERKHDSPFMQAYDQLVEKYRTESARRPHLSDPNGDRNIQIFFAPDGNRFFSMENPQTLDRPGLIDRIISSSYMPLPTDPRHTNVLKDIGTLFDAHQQNQTVQIQQETRIYHGQLQK